MSYLSLSLKNKYASFSKVKSKKPILPNCHAIDCVKFWILFTTIPKWSKVIGRRPNLCVLFPSSAFWRFSKSCQPFAGVSPSPGKLWALESPHVALREMAGWGSALYSGHPCGGTLAAFATAFPCRVCCTALVLGPVFCLQGFPDFMFSSSWLNTLFSSRYAF